MLFHTWTFLAFILVVVLAHRLLPWRAGLWFLLVASYFFYGCSTWYYIFLLFFCSLSTYLAALLLARSGGAPWRRLWLLVGIAAPLAVLAVFKYTHFALSQVDNLFGLSLVPLLDQQGLMFLLPVGISFYTFQAVAYVVDVYRGDLAPVRHFPTYALYISFFPQLVAGPIERGGNVLPQLARKHVPDADETMQAIYLFLRGLVKKMVFADRLGVLVDQAYKLPAAGQDGAVWWLATLCFSFQIYLDFSAYTDMARGCGSLIGIRLSENFAYPYLAPNPREFWRRWHISLSSWLRDYLYIPLGGNRHGKARHYLNILAVMLIAGLWHGAAWHFVAWGLFMGLLIVAYDMLRTARGVPKDRPLAASPLLAALGVGLTFACVTLGWVFFRADSVAHGWQIWGRMLAAPEGWGQLLQGHYRYFLLICALLYLTHWLGARPWRKAWLRPKAAWAKALSFGLRWGVMALLLIFGALERTTQFIYFEF
ncbi:MAG: hypothetical protein KQH53_05670 [Desulfarculaceae bacterium]|nr:hypothetical protein [Desulfarculaceae bacterium]